MRQPLWMINASLLCILLASELLFLCIQTSIPRKFSLTPDSPIVQEQKRVVVDVDLEKIYQSNDLFGTFIPSVPALAKGALHSQVPEIPEPPAAIPLNIPLEPAPVFIAPLAVTLKGIIYLQEDSEKSVAMIQFSDSKKEHNYCIGEMIQDAQILKIFPNRVIVVRSNGQQETLYLRTKDLEKDFALDSQKNIAILPIYMKEGTCHLPLTSFLREVHSLGQFIDMLQLRMVYEKGKSAGCRVHNAGKNSLGAKLGFEKDDLIKKVDTIPVVDLDSRIEIYDHLCDRKIGDKIIVELQRDTKLIILTFVLTPEEDLVQNVGESKALKSSGAHDVSDYIIEQNKKKILEQRMKLAPTAHQIQMSEQKKLLEARKKNMLSNQHVSNR